MNEEYKNIMKKVIMILMAVALIALPTMAQQQTWQSTSPMQETGSVYSSQVTAVGSVSATEMATTTETYSPAQGPNRARRDFVDPSNPGNQSGEYPLGDAVLPLMLCALAFGGVVAFRRRRAAE